MASLLKGVGKMQVTAISVYIRIEVCYTQKKSGLKISFIPAPIDLGPYVSSMYSHSELSLSSTEVNTKEGKQELLRSRACCLSY